MIFFHFTIDYISQIFFLLKGDALLESVMHKFIQLITKVSVHSPADLCKQFFDIVLIDFNLPQNEM